MNLDQLTPADRHVLEQAARAATETAAAALARMVDVGVEIGRSRLDVEAIAETHRLVDGLPRHVTVVYVEVVGSMPGHMVLVSPPATANALMHALLPDETELGPDRERARQDVIGEVGNIVLTTWMSHLADRTGLEAMPTTPLVATATTAAVMELPLSRAASDQDVVVRFDTSFALQPDDGTGTSAIRAPFHVLYLPVPGVLGRIVEALGSSSVAAGATRVPVRMGELAVSRRAGDVLVASALGSCVAIALVDRLAGVGAVAHVMLPEAPSDPASRTVHGKPTFGARYADSAVPALIDALEQAGGRRMHARAYLAGGGQMFRGSAAEAMDVPDRNLAAARAALRGAGIGIHGEDTGGTISRTLQLDISSMEVTVREPGAPERRLDRAA